VAAESGFLSGRLWCPVLSLYSEPVAQRIRFERRLAAFDPAAEVDWSVQPRLGVVYPESHVKFMGTS
jgi:hypothetical protein